MAPIAQREGTTYLVNFTDARGVLREQYITVVDGLTPGDAVDRMGGKIISSVRTTERTKI